MIGGQDILIPIASPLDALDVAIRAVRRLWPQCILEDAQTGEVLGRYADITLAGRTELLAFKNAQASRLWDEVGADETTSGTLIHLLISGKELTVVVDDEPSDEMKAYVNALRRALRQRHPESTSERKAA